MSAVNMNESVVEAAALTWLEGLGYSARYGPDIEPEGPNPERAGFGDVVLVERLRSALERINPKIPADPREEALRKLLRSEHPVLIENNRQFHHFLVEGVPVEFQSGGRTIHDSVKLIDFDDPDRNDWLAVNQYTVVEGNHNRRPDVAVFVNGLPLAVVELKNPADENATVRGAYNQLQTYQKEIPSLFPYNALLVISDGLEAKAGTLTSEWERFMPWRTVAGEPTPPKGMAELEVLIRGVFEKSRLLDFLRYFVVFETDGAKIEKKVAAYHQFHAVNKAVACTLKAASPKGDRRIGVVWHTQGSGKSLSMVFYAGKIIQKMDNPTVLVLTDRNDLDGQLFGTFSRCKEVLRQKPVQAESRAQLRELLKVASGGVVFATIQKFLPEQKGDAYPLLSDRRNVVVIADEAHRSQYDFIDGFARHMRDALPNASFIGFTGTPLERGDRNTPAVFGDYIDVYDILRAVEDKATVPIYYEGRLAKIELDDKEKPKIDPDFEEATEGEEVEGKERLKSKWARLEAMVGAEKRIGLVAKDLVEHFENRLGVMDGKGMVVCMSRRICVDLYNAIIRLRPQWHDEDDDRAFLKVVMTGSASDGAEWQQHIRNKKRREEMAKRFKDPAHPFKLVIVRDMWLTGFDAPCLHTMYMDKPMRSHGLMQTIARVNRVFKDKPGGLIVDYLGLAAELKKALADYTESGGKGKTALDQSEAVAVMQEKHEVVCAMFHGFDLDRIRRAKPTNVLGMLPEAIDFIAGKKDGKTRYLKAVADLSKAFALSIPHEAALAIRDDVGIFQTIRAQFLKHTVTDGKSPEDLDVAIRQIVSRAIVSDKVVDIFSAAGLKKPDLSILSDEFLQEMRDMPHRNLAVELLQKLLKDEIKIRSKKNLVLSRSFAEALEKAVIQYQNRAIEAAQVLEELIGLATGLRVAHRRGENLGLSEDELAFYDALEVNNSAVKILGDETLRTIARELVDTVRRNTSIDWTVRESVRAKMRVMVKKILRKHGYPPDKQEKATQTVLEQAELLCKDWVA